MSKGIVSLIIYDQFIKHQKLLSRGVLIKLCSENKQQIYSRAPMPKCNFNNIAILLRSHFGVGVLQHIFCIFTEHLSLRILLEGCF